MPVASATLSSLPHEKLFEIARTLPADLRVLSKLGQMLQSVNSDLDVVDTMLRKDVTLAGEVACWAMTAETLGGANLDENQFQAASDQAGRMFGRHRGAL